MPQVLQFKTVQQGHIRGRSALPAQILGIHRKIADESQDKPEVNMLSAEEHQSQGVELRALCEDSQDKELK